MKSEPAIVLGVVVTVLNALIVVLGAGGFDDGLQLADLVPIVAPVLAALGIRSQVTPVARKHS